MVARAEYKGEEIMGKIKKLLYEFGYECWSCGTQKIGYDSAEDIEKLAAEIRAEIDKEYKD
tara:strand:+ start:427 stop:609 length:183 start_codon:yes stop_codon:yes gene_type:complete